ncbi:YtxH domain-containing protein [Jeotgalicoccus meleagridis]|jgi:gas vesicle protein|uniref:YtxH-like protein n=1 Tax=Jeotgalicoccus meleagridis TaxID=2759181 RepID=A0A6V7RQR6_9STAP|nr:YtxH domain-containing protein [Jeotgalicoccus meleagridis]CAD2081286.1 YtxH-like protein [Jeotgalicoccus meleagridis]HIW37666.1 YtxH domain-containing protein [Candidatus Jeotgalicoccus stercoravium]
MKLKNIGVGFLVGVTGGVLISFLNAPKSGKELQLSLKSGSSDLKSQFNQLKIEGDEIKNSFLKTKRESSEVFQSLGDEVKTMISNFQADINPNIERLQGNIDNVTNRVETATDFPASKKDKKKD